MMKLLARGLFAVVVAAAAVFGFVGKVDAAGYFVTSEISRSHSEVAMKPGERKQFTIHFQNSGTASWSNSSPRFASIYTHGPKYRDSAFRDESWMSDAQLARMRQPLVHPGQTATFSFVLKAPLRPGTYEEVFHAALEDVAWIEGGRFTVKIEVKSQELRVERVEDVDAKREEGRGNREGAVEVRNTAVGYGATKLLVSDREVKLAAGTEKELRVAFKNTGEVPWSKFGSHALKLKPLSSVDAKFAHRSWDGEVMASLTQETVKPGQLVFVSFAIKAPSSAGSFTPKFALTAGDDLVEGGVVEIPVEVTGGSVPASIGEQGGAEIALSGDRGPNIRVGLFMTASPVTVFADGEYTLVNGDHQPVRTLRGSTTTVFDPATLTYTVRNGNYTFTDNKHVHFVPVDPAKTILEITSYENRAAWDRNVNFNKFRGTIEVYYSRNTGRLWVIEELPLEDYMRGFAETSNGSPYEYQKALVTAGRTFAMFVVSLGGKHKADHFDVVPNGNDQVYKGYTSELIRTNVVRAAEETRGKAVTYDGEVVVTPYFSRSDGRTRAWTEVWSSRAKPWLVSVPAPYDLGKTLWGHGVGMSASDAVGRAKAGANWEEILKYYYTGIDIKSIY